MEKSGRFPRGKPAAAESRYPAIIIHYQPIVYADFFWCDNTTGCEAYFFFFLLFLPQMDMGSLM